ncbi:MAG: hypothetical protein GX088_01260 [Clostridia bacterium]|nr:hypothetical protein [Clostridia bacterium]
MKRVDKEYIRLTSRRNGIEVCNVFPKRNDPESVERFKKHVAEMILQELEQESTFPPERSLP